ncbi:hypothetical protein J0X14_15860 [Muricauda sp. CAU 1633]|uniref:hypothetical protein n=1 Tax=Allomuricauda sp. CAU 1633 TaxID=2816036 RepID=UPI001A8C1A20|nr:hypothetical protein [Muricauda sp. CAU 1633]MBO0323786.1 hypothetical protein [Muricauda sp. CAU 1633]
MNTTFQNTSETTIPPKWRIYMMSGLFFLNFISLAVDNWSIILFTKEQLDPLSGVGVSFYAALSLLSLFGIRFPLKFTPLLLIQLIYKSAWLLGVYLPAINLGAINANIQSWFLPMAIGIVIDVVVIPWKYVYVEYCKNLFRFAKPIK